MRKLLSVLLLVSLLMGVIGISAPAAEVGDNLIYNGDLETLAGDGAAFSAWTLKDGSSVAQDRVHGGQSAVKMDGNDGARPSITQQVRIIPGAKYQAKAWVYVESLDEGARVTFTTTNYDYLGNAAGGWNTFQFKDITPLCWQEIVREITIPAEPLKKADFSVRLRFGDGVFYADDISLTLLSLPETPVEVPQVPDPVFESPPLEYRDPAPGHGELLTNGDMEELSANGGIEDWIASGRKWTGPTGCIAQHDVVRSGKTALKIVNNYGVTDSSMTQKLKLVPGAKYQASVWVNRDFVGTGGLYFSIAFWTSGYKKYLGGYTTARFKITNRTGEWVQAVEHFVAPDLGGSDVEFRIRMMGGDGDAYFDDVSLFMIEEPPMMTLDPGERFYYTEQENGFASARLDTARYPDLSSDGVTVDFLLKDGDTVIDQKPGASAQGDNIARWYFDLTKLEIGKDYTLEGVLRDAEGNALEVRTELFQRHMPRPTALTEEGFYKTQVKGPDGKLTDKLDENGNPEILDVMLAYTMSPPDEQLVYIAEQGVTAVMKTAPSDFETNDTLGDMLDARLDLGLRTVVGLYPNMKPAGHPENVERTKYYINKYKDHPGVLGWAVQDEPSAYFKNEDLRVLMEDSYKLIRSLDPVHPVYAVEATTTQANLMSKYVDIVANDPYVWATKPRSGFTSSFLREVSEIREYIKPGLSVVQFFKDGEYYPTSMELRHFIYESFMEGAGMLGYYCFKDAYGKGVSLHQTGEIWDALVEFGTGGEQRDAFDYFAYRKYPTFREDSTVGADAWHASYIKDGKLYMVILNMDEVNLNAAPCTVDIPLVSDDGTVTIEGYTATLLSGEGEATLTGDGTTMTVPLEQNACVVYEITPKNAVDFSSLPISDFVDLGRYPWAAGAIRALEARGIVEGMAPQAYMPGYKITRGDFAMNLVRTLGLTADSTENFADVDADSRYAKEIAIGRALGIFEGADDGNFNPDAEISRQDMMNFLRLALKTANMQETAMIDIAAQLGNNMAKGNIDASVPVVTRAEAAIALYRLLEWKEDPLGMEAESSTLYMLDEETAVSLMLSEGGTLEDGFWFDLTETEDGAYVAIHNGGAAGTVTVPITGEATQLLYGSSTITFSDSTMQAEVPANSTVLLRVYTESPFGLYDSDNTLLVYAKEGTITARNAKGTGIIAVYQDYAGTKELITMAKESLHFTPIPGMRYIVSAFDWTDKVMPQGESYTVWGGQ